MKNNNIIEGSSEPLYLQVCDLIIKMIEEGSLRKNSKIPSVNQLVTQLGVSRVTVVNSYNYLRNQGIISSKHGKGFYVARENDLRKKKVFLLFDAMNNYKEILYHALIYGLGDSYSTDICFHYYNLKQFERFIRNNNGDYNHYVVLPHFNEDVSEILKILPQENLLMLDKDIPELTQCSGIFQQFDKDVYTALEGGIHLLRKYNAINLFTGSDFQFIPDGISKGINLFCIQFGFKFNVIRDNGKDGINEGEVYLAFSENDLVTILQRSKLQSLKPGSDFGLISYDDTPLKAELGDGITTISTDFVHMGQMAAKMIREKIHEKIPNPCKLIIRNSL